MSQRYLEVTYRQGKPLAAYLYLPLCSGDHSVRVEPRGPGYLVDWTEDGRAIGIEMPSPSVVTLDGLNLILAELHRSAAPAKLPPAAWLYETANHQRCRLKEFHFSR